MWLQTKYGFYSVVEHNDDLQILMVRARSRDDLVNLCELADAVRRDYKSASVEGFDTDKIVHTPQADYHWRLIVPRQAWMELSLRLMTEIDYGNFKNAVAKRNRERADLYHEVWATLLDIHREGEDDRWELSDERALEDWLDNIGEGR
jgi:hypothetical protein